MRNRLAGSFVAVLAALAFAPTLLVQGEGQSAAASPQSLGHGDDLTGIWRNYPARLPESVRPYQNWAFALEPPPMTPWAQARFAEARGTFGPNNVPVAETNDPVYDCFLPGTPRIYFHPFPVEIVQTPGRVLMLFEYDHIVRQIYTDGRDHRDDLAPTWMGDSIGRWEGDTLVVESVNFNDRTWIDRRGVPHSEELRVVERIRRIEDDVIQIDITIEDPVAFTAPWTGQRFYERAPSHWTIEEMSCMDNVTFLEYEREVLEYGDNPAASDSSDIY